MLGGGRAQTLEVLKQQVASLEAQAVLASNEPDAPST